MPKGVSPRTTKPSNGPAARKRRTSPASGSNGEGAPLASVVSHESVAARAYGLFLARGGQPGDDLRDWFQAEAELRQELEAGRAASSN